LYLIDTNVISEIRRWGRANPGVRRFFERATGEGHALYLSVITVGELRRGVEVVQYRGDAPQAMLLEAWTNSVLEMFAHRILAIGEDAAQVWGRLRAPRAEHPLDKLIAATALTRNLMVVTRNVKDFMGTGVRVLNPFD
jgi:predicted nucleic acid-binding protein